MYEEILILANSRKLDGRCIAGKTPDGRWIRLVQDGKRAIPKKEGKHIKILSRYNVDILENRTSPNMTYHTENYTYNNLELTQEACIDELDEYLDTPDFIYGDTRRFLKFSEAKKYDNSLLFLKVSNLVAYKTCDETVRCDFCYNGQIYKAFCLTDSNVEKMFKKESFPHCEEFGDAYITVSIGIPFMGNVFKLVSGVIPA